MRIPRLGFPAVLLALAAGACRDLPTAAPPAQPIPEAAARAELKCAVSVTARSMTCEPSRPRGARSQIIMGGQGLNVRLRTTNLVVNPTLVTADISVQNLLDQPIGTDGTSTHGVRVFFVSGPTITDGTSGQVEVLTDSVAMFTAANQKYYAYHEVIQPRGVSSAQQWAFSMPGGTTAFEFKVLVETEIPAEQSALHFRPENGTPVFFSAINGVWAATPHDVFAVSDGAVLHYDGNYWRAMDAGPCGCEATFYGVWGSDGRDVFVVGGAGVYHWTGTTWDAATLPAELAETGFNGVWGADPENVWTVGDDGAILHYDGSTWNAETVDGFTDPLYAVWGANVENVWAVGEYGNILHYDGAWQQDTAIAGASFYSVWGTGGEDVWAAGVQSGDGGEVGALYHYDGTGWTQVSDPELETAPLFAGWSAAPNDVWINAGGDVLHYDGATWTRLFVGSGAPLYGITGTGASDIFTVGDFGTIAHSTGGEFATMTETGWDVAALWGSGENDVWAVGGPFLLHRAGTPTWTPTIAPVFEAFYGAWGTSASDAWAVGTHSAIIHYDGADWTVAHLDSAAADLRAVWGSSASDVWAAGDAGALLHWNGSDWTDAAFDAEDRTALWGTASDNVFAASASGGISRWTGGGWTAMNSGTSSGLHGIWGSGPNDVYAVGDNGTVLHYDGNPGQDWTPVATGAPAGASVFAVWGSGPSDEFILANNGLDLVHWNGTAWRTVTQYSEHADVRMYTLWGTGPQNLYAAGDVGTILHGER